MLDGRGRLDQLADPELAIAAAEAAGNVAALQGVSAPKALRKAAAAALHRLRSRGVKVEAQAPAAFTLSREELDVPSRAFLGSPDDEGEVPLVLTATSHGGTCLMEMFLGTADGRATHGHANRTQLREVWKNLEADPSLREVPFAGGLNLAFELLDGRSDHGWEHFLSHVPAAVQAQARADLATAAAVEEAVGADRVWMLPVRLVAPRAVEVGVQAMLQSTREEETQAWVPEGADAALEGEARAAFAAAADRLARIHRCFGREGAAADAERLAAQLREGVAGQEIPAVRNTVERAVAARAMEIMKDFFLEQQQQRG